MKTQQEYIEQGEQYILKTYNRFPVVLEKGEGVYLYDADQKKYLDFGAGIAVFALGYGNEAYNQALKDQIDKLIHTSNLYYNIPAVEAAKKIVDASGLKKVFFTNSGTEAIEGALKVARKYAYNKDDSKDYEFIAMNHSFHGRSQGALSVTGNSHYQDGFVPKEFRAVFAEFNNLEDVVSKITDKTCGIICEVVQGEGGIFPADKEFLEGLRKVCDKLPEALEKIAPVLIYPVVGVLLMGLCMTFIVEPIMGGINTGLNNALTGMGNSSKVILGLVLGGMMAIDMGGPFNKAAYVFGTAAIAAGNYDIMAAVMVGGMTPPCAIALASLLFKDKFTKEEREAGPTNFIMGLAFITEGAIPFAASDPIHVLPSCIVGSAIAGAISMFFNCTLMAPHGGIFVFPVVGNALMYLVALVVGTLISAVLLGVLKKKVA